MDRQDYINLYVDDSGSRIVSRNPRDSSPKFDYFALGGLIVAEKDKNAAKQRHAEFCGKWNITYHLHSVKIRHASDEFSWIQQLSAAQRSEFFDDLHQMVRAMNVKAIASTVNRPGYIARYRDRYPDSKWLLCKTCFPILIERAVRFALERNTKLCVYVERSGRREDQLMTSYIRELKRTGMPFDKSNSAKYTPLTADEFNDVIYEFAFKTKETKLMQIADLLVYALARGGFEPDYRAFQALRQDGLLIESVLPVADIPFRGSKYSCFDAMSNVPQAPLAEGVKLV